MAFELLEAETEAMRPRVLPRNWVQCETFPNKIYSKELDLSIVWSVERIDGKVWRHVSIAHRTRMPTYHELRIVKVWLLGAEAKAIQVFAPASEHVNVHPFALHLWAPVGHDPLPDFRREGGL